MVTVYKVYEDTLYSLEVKETSKQYAILHDQNYINLTTRKAFNFLVKFPKTFASKTPDEAWMKYLEEQKDVCDGLRMEATRADMRYHISLIKYKEWKESGE